MQGNSRKGSLRWFLYDNDDESSVQAVYKIARRGSELPLKGSLDSKKKTRPRRKDVKDRFRPILNLACEKYKAQLATCDLFPCAAGSSRMAADAWLAACGPTTKTLAQQDAAAPCMRVVTPYDPASSSLVAIRLDTFSSQDSMRILV